MEKLEELASSTSTEHGLRSKVTAHRLRIASQCNLKLPSNRILIRRVLKNKKQILQLILHLRDELPNKIQGKQLVRSKY